MALAVDGPRVALGAADGALAVIPLEGGAPAEARLEQPVEALAWGPDGLVVAIGEKAPGRVRLLDAALRPVAEWAAPGVVNTLTRLPDGRWAVGLDTGQVKLLDARLAPADQLSDPRARPMQDTMTVAHSRAVSAALVHDGRLLTGSVRFQGGAATIRRWRLDAPSAPEELCPGHQEGVESLAVTSAGLLVVGTRAGTVEVWVLPE